MALPACHVGVLPDKWGNRTVLPMVPVLELMKVACVRYWVPSIVLGEKNKVNKCRRKQSPLFVTGKSPLIVVKISSESLR